MALALANRVRETTTTTGTGTVTLAGAVTGYQSFSVVGNANTTYYCIAGQGTSEWEVGIGTYTLSGTTLARTTILSSSNGGSAVSFSAGTKDVFVTYPSEKSVNLDASGNVTLPGTLVGPASATVFNTVSTTVNAFGAATTLNIGNASMVGGTAYMYNGSFAGTLGVTGTSTLATVNASGSITTTNNSLSMGAGGTSAGLALFTMAGSSNAGGGPVLRMSRNSVTKWEIGTQSTFLSDGSDNLNIYSASALLLSGTQAGAVTIPGTLDTGTSVRVGTSLATLLIRQVSGTPSDGIEILNTYYSGSQGPLLFKDGTPTTMLSLTGAAAVFSGTLGVTGQITASATGGGVTFASTGGQNIRVYGGSASHQWDIYGNGTNLRIGDNTGGGSVVIDTALGVNGGNTVFGKFIVKRTAGTGSVLLDSFQATPTTEAVLALYTSATAATIEAYNNAYLPISIGGGGAVTIPGTLGVTGTFTPGQTTGIVGTTTNNSAQAGSVGEYIASSVSSVTINTATVTNITTISLTAGDWDVTASFNTAGVTTQGNCRYAISQTSADFTGGVSGLSDMQAAANTAANVCSGTIANFRISLSGTATIYFIGQAGTANLGSVSGTLRARRVR